jgi:hypothetical protein
METPPKSNGERDILTGPKEPSNAMRMDCARHAPQHLRASKGRPTAVRTGVCAGRCGPLGAKLGILTQGLSESEA